MRRTASTFLLCAGAALFALLLATQPAISQGTLGPTGDITSVGATSGGGLTGGATRGPALLGLLTTCGTNEILKWSGSAWACAADSGGTSYTAGDGITLTASDFDLDYTADFQITGGQLDTSTTFTLPGTLDTVGNATFGTGDVLVTADTFSSVLHGEIQIPSNLSGKAPMGIGTAHGLWNGTDNPIAAFGYNTQGDGGKWLAAENTIGYYVEGDYNDGATRTQELYSQYVSDDGGTSLRPFFFQIDRTSDQMLASWIVGDPLNIKDDAGNTSASFSATSATLYGTLQTDTNGSQIKFDGTNQDTYFNYAGGATESTYIRGGKTASVVYVGDANTGGVNIGATGNLTNVVGSVTVANDSTLGDATTDVLDAVGNLSKFGSGFGGHGNSYVYNETFNFFYGYDADAAGYINYTGYNRGTTRFRDLIVADGKNATIATFTGSTKGVQFAATVGATGLVTATAGVTTPANLTTTGTGDVVSGDSITSVNGVTLGTDSTDASTLWGQITIRGSTGDSYFNYGGGDTYIRSGTSGSIVYVGDSNTGGVRIGAASNPTTVYGSLTADTSLTVNGDTILGNANTDIVSTWGRTHFYGTAPTLSGCTSVCTMASYSTDARGRISCTDDSGADCTVTFSIAYDTNAPACSLTYEDTSATKTAPTGTPWINASSTSAFSFDQVGGAQAHAYVYRCDGMK